MQRNEGGRERKGNERIRNEAKGETSNGSNEAKRKGRETCEEEKERKKEQVVTERRVSPRCGSAAMQELCAARKDPE